MEATLRGQIGYYERCLSLVRSIHPDVLHAGMELFESEEHLVMWLCQPARALGQQVPLFHLRTKAERASVVHVLRAIDYGVYL